MLQLGVRFYDPNTGRFTQLDPIGDGINWYAYAGGNPVGYVDPDGLSRKPTDRGVMLDDLFGDDPYLRSIASYNGPKGFIRSAVISLSSKANDSYNCDLVTMGMNGYGWSRPVGILLAEDAAQRLMDITSIMPAAGLIEGGITGGYRLLGRILKIDPWRWELHHLLPQAKQFSEHWLRVGLTIDDCTVWLPRWKHVLLDEGIHTIPGGNWNREWKLFFEKNPLAGKDDIIEQLYIMIDDFHLWEWFPGY